MDLMEPEWEICVRPMPGEVLSGDLGMVRRAGNQVFVALIDGAGHGPEANQAASGGIGFLDAHQKDASLPDLILGLHEELRGGRGAVVSMCRLDIASRFVDYVGIGNISARIYGSENHEFVNRTGLVGSSIPPIPHDVERRTVAPGDLLVLHSDGISSRSRVSQVDGLVDAGVEMIADELIERFAKKSDDASCIVLRC